MSILNVNDYFGKNLNGSSVRIFPTQRTIVTVFLVL